MLLSTLFLLPAVLASTVTIYLHPVPHSAAEESSIIPSAVPLVQVDYDAEASANTPTSPATVLSYTPPTGSYSSSRLLRIGLHDAQTGSWRGVVTSAASFADEYKKTFVVHVDEKGEPYHVGFGTSLKEEGEDKSAVKVEIVRRGAGPKPILNKAVPLNAEGKREGEPPEKTFLQKYWWAIALFLVIQLVAGGGGDK